LPGRSSAFAFTADSQRFFTVSQAGVVRLWNTFPVRELEQITSLGRNNCALNLSPDGRWLALGERTGAIRIYEWPAGRALTNISVPPALRGRLCFSPHGRFLLASWVGLDNAMVGRAWDTGNWRELPNKSINFNGILSMSASPDERFLAIGYESGAVRVWNLPLDQMVADSIAHSFGAAGIAFAPEGQILVTTGRDSFITFWDASAWRPLLTFRGHRNAARGPVFSPDGRRLATAGGSPQDAVKLWDLATARELITLAGEGVYFDRVFFSPDGNTLAAMDVNGLTHLWHAPSFAEIEAAELVPKKLP
jgi:WD40 repeat protein